MCAPWLTDVGDHRTEDPTCGFAKRVWDFWSSGLPCADVRLDPIGSDKRLALADQDDGAAEPDASNCAIGEEAVVGRAPALDEEIEALVKSALGILVEIGGATGGIVAGTASTAGCAALSPLGRAPRVAALVHVADDSGEVAIADAGLAAARVRAEAALGVVQIVERVAAKRSDEGFARAGHRVLVVHRFEEEPHGAFLGASVVPLLLDDRAEHVGILSVERMAEVPPTGEVHTQEGRDEELAEVRCEIGAAQRGDRVGEAIREIEDRRDRVLHGAEAALDGGLLRRRAFALRRVLDGERVVRGLRGLGDEGLALVGDVLQTLAASGGLGDDGGDERGRLAPAIRKAPPRWLT